MALEADAGLEILVARRADDERVHAGAELEQELARIVGDDRLGAVTRDDARAGDRLALAVAQHPAAHARAGALAGRRARRRRARRSRSASSSVGAGSTGASPSGAARSARPRSARARSARARSARARRGAAASAIAAAAAIDQPPRARAYTASCEPALALGRGEAGDRRRSACARAPDRSAPRCTRRACDRSRRGRRASDCGGSSRAARAPLRSARCDRRARRRCGAPAARGTSTTPGRRAAAVPRASERAGSRGAEDPARARVAANLRHDSAAPAFSGSRAVTRCWRRRASLPPWWPPGSCARAPNGYDRLPSSAGRRSSSPRASSPDP